MARLLSSVLVVLACLVFLDGAMAQNRGYLATLEGNPNHKMMVAMVKSNRIYSAMLASATIPMTIFAPTDSAFNKTMKAYGIKDANAAMRNSTLTNMLMNNVLMMHVVQGKILTSSAFTDGATFTTLKKSGNNNMQLKVTVDTKTKKKYIKGVGSNVGPKAQIVKADQIVLHPRTGQRLGAIHDISGVLLPDVRITL